MWHHAEAAKDAKRRRPVGKVWVTGNVSDAPTGRGLEWGQAVLTPIITAEPGGYVTMIIHSNGKFSRYSEKTFVSHLQKEQIFEEKL